MPNSMAPVGSTTFGLAGVVLSVQNCRLLMLVAAVMFRPPLMLRNVPWSSAIESLAVCALLNLSRRLAVPPGVVIPAVALILLLVVKKLLTTEVFWIKALLEVVLTRFKNSVPL